MYARGLREPRRTSRRISTRHAASVRHKVLCNIAKRSMMLLRFDGASQRDPKIHIWMQEHAGELGAIAEEWFAVMRNCGDEVLELFHDGCPVVCLGDAPFAYVNVFTAHV